MLLTLHIPWIMIDFHEQNHRPILVPPGYYDVERRDNPYQKNGTLWLVIIGTTVGLNESFAQAMSGQPFGNFRLELQTTPKNTSPSRRLENQAFQ